MDAARAPRNPAAAAAVCRRNTRNTMTSRRNTSSRRRCIPLHRYAAQPPQLRAPAAVRSPPAARYQAPEQDYYEEPEPQHNTPTSRSRTRRAMTTRCMGGWRPASTTISAIRPIRTIPTPIRARYEEEPAPKKRSSGLMTVAAVLALAVVGTGAAFAYRTFVGSPRSGEPPIIRADNSPTKVVPAPSDAAPPRPLTACCRAMAARSWCRAKRRRSTSIRGPAGRAWCFRS